MTGQTPEKATMRDLDSNGIFVGNEDIVRYKERILGFSKTRQGSDTSHGGYTRTGHAARYSTEQREIKEEALKSIF